MADFTAPNDVRERREHDCGYCGLTYSTSEEARACCPKCDHCGNYYCERCYTCGEKECHCACCIDCGDYPCQCCDCGYHVDNCHCDMEYERATIIGFKQVSRDDITAKFGLEPDAPLQQLIADYYLLQHLWSNEKLARAYRVLATMSDRYAPQFATYLDLACGGEIRHGRVEQLGGKYEVSPVRKRAGKNVYGDRTYGGLNRTLAWDVWPEWRTPVERADYAERVFLEPKLWGNNIDNCGYGGRKWSNIAYTLKLYLNKQVDNIAFLDRVWNLQHNGGIALNKIYQEAMYHPNKLKRLLNAHGRDNYKTLMEAASDEVQSLWKLNAAWKGQGVGNA